MEYLNLTLYFVVPALIALVAMLLVIWIFFPRGVKTTFVREMGSYFYSPIAYVCVVIFILIANVLAFWFGGFIERGDASLTDSFFTFHPWIYIVVAPAVGMRLWSEEHRQGTIELLLTMPLASWQAILGKFFAACVVMFAALFFTLPVVYTMEYLGDPDYGPMMTGYVGSFLLAVACLGVTSAVSAFTRSQVVALLVSIFACMLLTIVGFPPVTDFFTKLLPWTPAVAEIIANFGFMEHFTEFTKGILVVKDLVFFLTFTALCLFVTAVVIRVKRA